MSTEINVIRECLEIIEKKLDKIVEMNHNGGLEEEVDTEEVKSWQRKVLTEKLEKSKPPCPTLSRV